MNRMRIERGAVLALLVLSAFSARAEPTAAPESDADRMKELERRVGELEQKEAERNADRGGGGAWLPEWTQRVRLSGSASVGYFYRGDLTPEDDNAFEVWDARLFVDAELADHVQLGGATAVRNIGATFEWNL